MFNLLSFFQMSEERRCELNKEKAKAIKIEEKLQQKRTSIDSGIIIENNIDCLKMGTIAIENNDIWHGNGGNVESAYQNNELLPQNILNDSFFKSALDDLEFREFFCSAAENYFNETNETVENGQTHQICTLKGPTNSQEERSNGEVLEKEPLKTMYCPTKSNENVHIESNDRHKNYFPVETSPEGEHISNFHLLSTPIQRVRRNSYTLDSPSPVLLEHIARQNTVPIGQKTDNWDQITKEREGIQSLGFKTFSSIKKDRKTWHKQKPDIFAQQSVNSPHSIVPNYLTNKTETFVKTSSLNGESNKSFPCSLCSSPTNLDSFTYSCDSIQSDFRNPLITSDIECTKYKSSEEKNSLNGLQPNILPCANVIIIKSNYGVGIAGNVKCSKKDTHPFLSDCEKVTPSWDYPGTDQDLISQNMSDQSTLLKNSDLGYIKESCNDLDDTLSVCSSLSLEKYLPNDTKKIPPTVEDLSSILTELQLQREHQAAQLFGMQNKEEIIFSQSESNNCETKIKNPVNGVVSEHLIDCDSLNTLPESIERRKQCSRELFPLSKDCRSSNAELARLSCSSEIEVIICVIV